MVNYQNGKIYKITGTTDDGKELIYIGSTTLILCQRLAGHKNDIKQGCNPSSKQVVLCNNCLITLIELFPCNTKEELLMKERYYYDLYDCINKLKPFRFKEEEKEYQKEYYEENKEIILKKGKEKVTCECGCIFRKDGLFQHKKTKKHIQYCESQL